MSVNFLFETAAPTAASTPQQGASLPGGGQHLVVPGLDAHERSVLNGLAAYQLRYGQTEEALALLQLSSRLWPNDRQTLRLLTQAFIAIGDFEAADMTDSAYRRLSAPIRPTRLDHLRRAIIDFGRSRVAEARTALKSFFSSGTRENRSF